MRKKYIIILTFLIFIVGYLYFEKTYIFLSPAKTLSYCVVDINGDEKNEILAITTAKKQFKSPDDYFPKDEKYGDKFYILDNAKQKIFGIYKIIDLFDFEDLKPTKVLAGDINGDSKIEISIIVYKKAEFHDEYAKRPFFYAYDSGNLHPVWLGSRLSSPFLDYILVDINNDGIDNIVSIEETQSGNYTLNAYNWKYFGFESIAKSEEYTNLTNLVKQNNFVIVEVQHGNLCEDIIFTYSENGNLIKK